MFERQQSQENEINWLYVYENQSNPKPDFLSFGRSNYKGENPILLIVKDSQKIKRAKYWGKKLFKLYNIHTKAMNIIDLQKIQKYIEQHKIVSVIIFDLDAINDEIQISTNNDSLFSFLSKSFSTVPHQFIVNKEEDKINSSNILTTTFKIGQRINLRTFISFITSFVHFHMKLSWEHKESTVLDVSRFSVKQNIPYNRVEIHPDILIQFGLQENDYVVIYHPLNCKFSVASVKSSIVINRNEIIVSLSIKKKLELWPHAKIVVHPLRRKISPNIQIQNVKQLADGTVIVSDDIYQQMNEMGAEHFEIVNRITSASVDIDRLKIVLDGSLKPGTIKMSYLQREFLDFEHPPNTLSDFYYNLYINTPRLNENQVAFIRDHYENNKVHHIDSYEEKLKAKEILKAVGYNHAVIYPLPEKRRRTKSGFIKNTFDIFFNWSIRPASLKLKVIRPYSTDESSNIVRISKSVMSLLGIEENDIIQLKYRGRSIKVPVLELDSTELIKETNIVCNESSINISIGIPAYLRDKLGIKQIGKICRVERDLKFLFRKNWNKQFLPIIATIFTIYSFDIEVWIKIVIMFVIIPISSYITLSGVREKIQKL